MPTTFGLVGACLRGRNILAITLASLSPMLVSRANPTGGQVVGGSASITTVPGTVTVNQSSSSAIINWQDFSIASGELTQFQVPSSVSATLNRVTGGNVSAIYGTLRSNGQLYLINPNGIVVGASGRIDTAGFMATTLNFSDTQFDQQGDLHLHGSSTAGIVNQGKIHASTGDVYLIAAQVDNSGSITARKGTVGLAAGNRVLLQKAGDQHLFVEVDNKAKTQATGVTNSGAIRSAAAELKAAGGNAYALAINNSGNIAATGIKTINGQVYLTADGADITNSGSISAKQVNGNGGTVVLNGHSAKAKTQGTVLNSGTISATGTASGATGGTVELLGNRVGVTDNGLVDVSGAAGGGTALIGGDEHGSNAAIPDASQTYIGPDATIKADALTLGNGGKVIVWANDTTQVYGKISAQGGAAGGNGGFVETSGAQLQVLTAPDVFAPKGTSGSWLLDPSDVTISDGSDDSGFTPGAEFTLNSNNVTISQSTLLTALETGDVIINAGSGTGEGSGTITWTQSQTGAFNIANPDGHTLTLDAPVSLTLTGVTITASGSGGLSLVLNTSQDGSGSVSLANTTINLNGGDFTANADASVSLASTTITAAGLVINGTSSIAGAAGVSITNSTLTATGNDGFFIQGTGFLAAGGDATGILISNSTLTSGSADSPGSGYFSIEGTSNDNSTLLAPNEVFANNSYGVQILNSNITSYSSKGLIVTGTANEANNLESVGVDLNGGDGATVLQTYNGQNLIEGTVAPEQYVTSQDSVPALAGVSDLITSGSSGAANLAIGVRTAATQINATGPAASIDIQGYTFSALATDNGNTEATAQNIGVYLLGGTSITASGNTSVSAVPIHIFGSSGTVQTSDGNTAEADTMGVWLNGGTTGATITNSGQGATVIAGEAGAASGPQVVSLGVALGDDAQARDIINSPNGGSIGIDGLGGILSGSSTHGTAGGVGMQYNTVSTTTGDITILAAAGSTSGTVASSNLFGLGMTSATVETNTTADTNQIVDGIAPPLILIYATGSSLISDGTGPNGNFQFQLGSPSSYAVQEDGNSSLVTANLVMGNFGDVFSASNVASTIDRDAPFPGFDSSLASVGNPVTPVDGGSPVTYNPGGFTDLDSYNNRVTNLAGALDGNGGFSFYDGVSLNLSAVGGAATLNNGQIDQAGMGSVSITMARNQSLTLTNVSPLTGETSDLPVIAASGDGSLITLTTSGTGDFINTAGSNALGSAYIIYANSPSQVILDGLAPSQPLFGVGPGGVTNPMGNTIAYATSGTGTPVPGLTQTFNTEVQESVKQVNDALYSPPPLQWPNVIVNPSIVGGAGGVADGGDEIRDFHLFERLKHEYGRARATELMAVIEADLKDGSTVNTGTVEPKWAANTGMSKLVRIGEYAQIVDGLTLSQVDDKLVLDIFQHQSDASIKHELSDAANEGAKGNRGHD